MGTGLTNCPLCGSSATAPELEVARAPVWWCRECDLLFIPAALAPPAEHYDDQYFSGDDFAGPSARARRLRRFVPAAARLARRAPPGRVLDVGTGTGEFLVLMRALGWKVAGIEVSAAACGLARERNELALVPGDYRTIADAGTYDAITAFDFFSHLDDPRGFFAWVRERLVQGGRLVLRTGDHRRLTPAAIIRRGWGSPREHRLLMSRQTLDFIAAAFGLTVESVEYLHPWTVGGEVIAGAPQFPALVPVLIKDWVQALLTRALPSTVLTGNAFLAFLRRK